MIANQRASTNGFNLMSAWIPKPSQSAVAPCIVFNIARRIYDGLKSKSSDSADSRDSINLFKKKKVIRSSRTERDQSKKQLMMAAAGGDGDRRSSSSSSDSDGSRASRKPEDGMPPTSRAGGGNGGKNEGCNDNTLPRRPSALGQR